MLPSSSSSSLTGGVAADALASVLSVLRVNGRLPRRAVVLDDGKGLADKTTHPDLPELDLVSRLCEVARQATGAPCYPRRTEELLEVALMGNSPGAWEAVRDDVATGDLDLDAALAVLRQGSNAAALVACLVGSRDAAHAVHVVMFLGRVLDRLFPEARAEMARALACQLRAVVDVFAAHGEFLARDLRDAVLDGFGRLLGAAELPCARTAELVVTLLQARRDDSLRMFMRVPPGFAAHRPEIPDLLAGRAVSAPRRSRYPPLAMLARVVTADPEALPSGRVDAIVEACAAQQDGETCDARTCLAVSTLVSVKMAHDPSFAPSAATTRAMADGMRSCAASLVLNATSLP